MKDYILEHDKYPEVSTELLEILEEIFTDTVTKIDTVEELHFSKGQQSVITFLKTVHENQKGE